MRFQAIDPIIEVWAASHGFVLFAGEEARFCYTSSERGECFQLVIRAPLSGSVTIESFSIETLHDEELHRAWTVPVSQLSDALEDALRTVKDWKAGLGRSA